ncbi:MAG: hypothetical protein ABEH56_02175 [Salinirussus sp.]
MNVALLLRQYRPDRRTLLVGAAVLNAEFILVAAYLLATGVVVRRPLLYAVPFVWINLGAWAVVRTDPGSGAGVRKRLTAGVLAGGYFLVLAYFGGLIGPGGPVAGLSVELTALPPGWSPAVLYNGPALAVVVLPYKLVGYAALAYLVYATALDAANAVLGGALGLFSCVSCTFPVLAGFATGIVGSGGALAAFTATNSYLLSTVVFAATVGLLYWRPTASTLRRWPWRD